MNDFDTFRREAEAALRVALQWFFLAVPMGLLCGFLGTLFHLAVEHATELRAAQPWLLFLLPVAGLLITALYKVTKCEGVGTNNVLRAVQSGEVVPIFFVGATFGCVVGPLLGLPAGFAAAVGLVSIFCGATNALIPSILLAFELFSGAGLELIALGCGICYMLSGHHGLYSSQTFVTNKLRSEYMSHKWRVKVKKAEE